MSMAGEKLMWKRWPNSVYQYLANDQCRICVRLLMWRRRHRQWPMAQSATIQPCQYQYSYGNVSVAMCNVCRQYRKAEEAVKQYCVSNINVYYWKYSVISVINGLLCENSTISFKAIGNSNRVCIINGGSTYRIENIPVSDLLMQYNDIIQYSGGVLSADLFWYREGYCRNINENMKLNESEMKWPFNVSLMSSLTASDTNRPMKWRWEKSITMIQYENRRNQYSV